MQAPKLTSDPVLARAHYAWWFRASGARLLRRTLAELSRRMAPPPSTVHGFTAAELAELERQAAAELEHHRRFTRALSRSR
jgi:hypothetical protein